MDNSYFVVLTEKKIVLIQFWVWNINIIVSFLTSLVNEMVKVGTAHNKEKTKNKVRK